MSKRPAHLLIEDIWDAMTRIEQYTAGLAQAQFLTDRRTSDAVVRNLEIIGEAANRLPIDVRQQHPQIEWQKIVGLRHRIVHDYFGIDLEMVWEILRHDLPAFKTKLQALRL